MPRIKTPKGTYKYKLVPIYPGWKLIDKEKAFENLCLFKEIADRNGFKFFLAYGTLLGAAREKDFITHDEDIDLGADYQDVNRFLSMLFELREHGFEVARWDDRGLISVIRNNEYIDVYFFTDFNDKLLINCGEPLPRKFFDNQANIEFKGVEFSAPADVNGVLEYWYGKDWRTPAQWLDYHAPKWRIWIFKLMQWVKLFIPKCLTKNLLKRKEQAMFNKYLNRGVLDEYLEENK